MVEVFKTDVCQVERSIHIGRMLLQYFPENTINFDLEDCDKILRVEGKNVLPEKIIQILNEEGIFCEVLE